jgi:uncharacterized protein
MSAETLFVLIVVFFLTSVVGVVTGSNSLIAVPAMFHAGIDPKVAVATNMFGLLFMAAGGTIPFVRKRSFEIRPLVPFLALTAISSTAGALLVGLVRADSIKVVVSVAMVAVALFILLKPAMRTAESERPGRAGPLTYALVFALGIYGGFFSGGYVTILTAVCVGIYGMRYSEAVGATKLINVVSSGVATIAFMWQGLVDYRLGLILGLTMFAGAYVGAHYAVKLDEARLRRVFLTAVFLLAAWTIYGLF